MASLRVPRGGDPLDLLDHAFRIDPACIHFDEREGSFYSGGFGDVRRATLFLPLEGSGSLREVLVAVKILRGSDENRLKRVSRTDSLLRHTPTHVPFL